MNEIHKLAVAPRHKIFDKIGTTDGHCSTDCGALRHLVHDSNTTKDKWKTRDGERRAAPLSLRSFQDMIVDETGRELEERDAPEKQIGLRHCFGEFVDRVISGYSCLCGLAKLRVREVDLFHYNRLPRKTSHSDICLVSHFEQALAHAYKVRNTQLCSDVPDCGDVATRRNFNHATQLNCHSRVASL